MNQTRFEYKHSGLALDLYWDGEEQRFRATCEPLFTNVILEAQEINQAKLEVVYLIRDTAQAFLGRIHYICKSIAPKAS